MTPEQINIKYFIYSLRNEHRVRQQNEIAVNKMNEREKKNGILIWIIEYCVGHDVSQINGRSADTVTQAATTAATSVSNEVHLV